MYLEDLKPSLFRETTGLYQPDEYCFLGKLSNLGC